MNVVEVLEDVLQARTAEVRTDPRSLERIREQLLVEAPPARRGHRAVVGSLLAAAAVIGVATAAALVGGGGTTGEKTGGTAGLPGYPLLPSQYFIARQGSDGSASDVVVRAADRRIVGTMPTVKGRALDEPQLSPDGTRAYVVFGRTDLSVGYVNTLDGTITTLDERAGNELFSPTVSADGSTLAYGWSTTPDAPETVVVRNLRTGTERLLTGLPNSPLLQPLALSPDGSSLAYIDENSATSVRIVSTTRSGAPFADATEIPVAHCSGADATSVHWTSRALYATQTCAGYLTQFRQVLTATSRILSVDVDTRTVHTLRTFDTPQASLRITVLDAKSGPLFATTTTAIPGEVTVRDPAKGWRGETVDGVDDLDVAGH